MASPSLERHQARTRDGAVFACAMALAVVHALDDAFVGRQPGVPLGQHALAGLASVVLAALALVAFPRVRPGVRAALAVALGVPAVANGAMHAVHIAFETVNIAWPRTALAPPGAPTYQVWAAPIVLAGILLVGVAYMLVARPDRRVSAAP